jgi:hypothetical protein
MALDSVKTFFNDQKFTTHAEAYTEAEVQELEKKLNIKFPAPYRDFLLWMGKNRAGIDPSSAWAAEDLPGLKAKILQAMKDMNFPEKLPDDAFVFWDNQDYAFTFLRLSQGDNSPVYRYHQTLDPTTFAQTHASFSDWLAEHIQAHVNKMKQLGERY